MQSVGDLQLGSLGSLVGPAHCGGPSGFETGPMIDLALRGSLDLTTGLFAIDLFDFARSFASAGCWFVAGLLPIGPATESVTDPAAGRRSVGAAEFKQSGGGSSSALVLGKICAIEFKQGEGSSAAPVAPLPE